ncbi:MAG: RNA polymerase sporulation sigma factor SigG [Clostridia bacterium]|jgi:RNA polymerase sporulation-specific sigma factor|nr:RNA polymerase sporulation sigma factor SigG [Clostridia bacterium]
MYIGKVEICGINTSKLKVLSDEEKDELLKRTKEGDEEARSSLIDGNLKLVLSIVQRFSSRGENPDDLFQIGCVGLIKAVDNFNTELNLKFSTYAVPMIIGEIRRYLRDNNSIRVSRSIRDLAYRALTAREELSKEMAKEPSIDEIYALMKKNGETHTRAEVVSALEAIVEPVSLFDPVYSDGGSSDAIYIMDQISDNENTDEAWLEDIALRDALKKLNERERMIIDKRFFSGKTQMEIADEIGISQAQVSRLEKSALERIKKQL